MRLDELATVVRSKNAGPCMLTFDLIFPDRERFTRVGAQADKLRDEVAVLYGLSANQVRVFVYEPALAVKVSIPRDVISGDVDDRDVYGAQQHRPLLGIDL